MSPENKKFIDEFKALVQNKDSMSQAAYVFKLKQLLAKVNTSIVDDVETSYNENEILKLTRNILKKPIN